MKRNEILNISVEQLRVEIAKRKGYKNISIANPGDYIMDMRDYAEGGEVLYEAQYRTGMSYAAEVPDYPNDIIAALPLLAEMADEGLTIVIYKENGLWVLDTDNDQSFAISKQLPDAISRAWLMWKEKGEK